ncbi:uroporphyrinogen-III synthase [Bacillus oleivorans]|uniref:Uroporphyrinogen-III synthase n=1 Tax=Bacillus oleivorans TaxID=1448271 RepID=A0A285CVC7_9BACI|nr:uroporphyrinogen-III synthase [Bacillus oleivorans]SNX71512.1 uroporphyrinogen-III synthase [Bacillus oleivorans]
MYSDQPLKGYHVLFPRGGEAAKKFAHSVEQAGGVPYIAPLIDFQPIDFSILHESYNWIIFTSQNAVTYFFEKVKAESLSAKIAAVGKKTAAAVEKRGLSVQFTPSVYVADVFVQEFAGVMQGMDRILLPRGNLAGPTIKNELTAKGAFVEDPIVYETYFPEKSRELLSELLEQRIQNFIIAFTSPSTVQHFMDVYLMKKGRIEEKAFIYAVIGSSTRKALKAYGIEADIIPEQYTFDDLFQAIVKYIKSGGCINA